MIKPFTLADEQTATDLQYYLTRAKRLDPDGLVRLRAFGNILAAYVAPIFSGNLMDTGPTILGLRTCDLAVEAEVDAIVPISGVLERLARLLSSSETKEFKIELVEESRAPWAGISPPRQGWQQIGTINETRLTQIARDGIEAVAKSIPESVGGPIAARLRGEIWGKGIDLDSQLPTGAAFVAAGLGFLIAEEEVGLYATAGWVRLSSEHGHVLSKVATKY